MLCPGCGSRVRPLWNAGTSGAENLWTSRASARENMLKKLVIGVKKLWTGCGRFQGEGMTSSIIRRTSAGSVLTPRATMSLMRAFGPGSSWAKMRPISFSMRPPPS